RQRRFPLSYQRFATIVKMFCHGFRNKRAIDRACFYYYKSTTFFLQTNFAGAHAHRLAAMLEVGKWLRQNSGT
ncbi:hypothetical protein P4519_14925, partial [Geobacillus stearothermophilus]|nr:hypothetical protein [Geobacillus stearothermophilus]